MNKREREREGKGCKEEKKGEENEGEKGKK